MTTLRLEDQELIRTKENRFDKKTLIFIEKGKRHGEEKS